MEIAAIVWLYIFGAAGFGAALQDKGENLHVFDFLMIVAWPIAMPLFMILRLIFNEILSR